MAFSGNFMCTSFKKELLEGVHNFKTGFTDFSDITFGSSTITARGALIYNDSASGDPTVVVLDFGSDKSSSSGDFTVQFPAFDASNAIIRIA